MSEKSNTNDSIDSVYGATRSPSANEDNGDENEEDEISFTLHDDASSSDDSDEESDASSASSMKKIKGKYAEEGKNDDSKDEDESSIESPVQFPTLFGLLHEYEPQYVQFLHEDGQEEIRRRRRIYEADKVKLKPRENPEDMVKYLKLSQMCQQEIMLEYWENELFSFFSKATIQGTKDPVASCAQKPPKQMDSVITRSPSSGHLRLTKKVASSRTSKKKKKNAPDVKEEEDAPAPAIKLEPRNTNAVPDPVPSVRSATSSSRNEITPLTSSATPSRQRMTCFQEMTASAKTEDELEKLRRLKKSYRDGRRRFKEFTKQMREARGSRNLQNEFDEDGDEDDGPREKQSKRSSDDTPEETLDTSGNSEVSERAMVPVEVASPAESRTSGSSGSREVKSIFKSLKSNADPSVYLPYEVSRQKNKNRKRKKRNPPAFHAGDTKLAEDIGPENRGEYIESVRDILCPWVPLLLQADRLRRKALWMKAGKPMLSFSNPNVRMEKRKVVSVNVEVDEIEGEELKLFHLRRLKKLSRWDHDLENERLEGVTKSIYGSKL
eukprot:CAMPEP_0178957914 /NCGR_PEP_ID=MMETSP0789-20121207/11234_1 /TAXON_ID=3005 /ORGANISM="Rhizosolenia setigera, Strain CCMP 1694" /LENGTH=551 /DNA_ID=CAMNT_0020640327 /DNA_START=155 /DNA_END=1808 /DNA_ORIENTATION=-